MLCDSFTRVRSVPGPPLPIGSQSCTLKLLGIMAFFCPSVIGRKPASAGHFKGMKLNAFLSVFNVRNLLSLLMSMDGIYTK